MSAWFWGLIGYGFGWMSVVILLMLPEVSRKARQQRRREKRLYTVGSIYNLDKLKKGER